MDKYQELHLVNSDLTASTGEDRLPMLKYITDNTMLDMPVLAPLVYHKYKGAGSNAAAPQKRKPQPQSKLVHKIKLSIQKATSISSASEFERPYFESIDQLHRLREQPPANAAMREKQFAKANMLVIDTVPEDSFRDRAIGALLGSMVADSCASYLGRLATMPTAEQQRACLAMSGSGAHTLSVG